MTTISDFITLLQVTDHNPFPEAIAYFEDMDFCELAKTYQDEAKNNLIHHTVQALVNKLIALYLPLESKKTYSADERPDTAAQEYTDTCLNLLRKMLDIGISPTPNLQKEKPLDLLLNAPIHVAFYKIPVLEKYLPFFESKSRLYDGRKYITHMNFLRSSKKEWKICNIPDAFQILDKMDGAQLTLHERLAINETRIRRHNHCHAKNLVVANLGYLISDLPKSDPNHKPVFVTVPIVAENYLVFAEKNLFEGTHSETALCYVLKKQDYLKSLLTDLKNLYPHGEGHKIYAIILDLHSTREVCNDCQKLLHGLQTDYTEDSFLKQFETLLLNKGYLLPRKSYVDQQENSTFPKLRLTLRASGILDPGVYEQNTNVMPGRLLQDTPVDIKLHPQQILFHLPPDHNRVFAPYQDRKIMGELQRRIS